MPIGRGVRFTVLVEDRALERFVRECLHAFGVHRREIRIVDYPAGRGSAKQWIDREYPAQVQAHRRRSFENIALIVATDADEQTVHHPPSLIAAFEETRRIQQALDRASS